MIAVDYQQKMYYDEILLNSMLVCYIVYHNHVEIHVQDYKEYYSYILVWFANKGLQILIQINTLDFVL